MASKKDPYITKRLNARLKSAKIERLIAQGWEMLPADVSGGLRSKREVILRKPNPKFKGATRGAGA